MPTLLLALLLAGCGKEEIRTYTVPKETAATAPAPHPHWTLPSGWTEQPASGMRVGSFTVIGKDGQQADVSIIPLSGQAGSDLDNVNRWRAQVGLQPVAAGELAALTEKVSIGESEGALFQMSGTSPETSKPTRLLGAILAQGGTTWFFKMLGSDTLVAEQKPAFQQFLKSISFHAAGEHAQTATAPAPPASIVPQHTATSSKLPAWEVPGSWQEQPATTMLLARFAMKDQSSGKADVTVSALSGEGGGLLANVNRWRTQQLGLGPIDTAELAKVVSPLEVNGIKATLVEMANPKPSSGGGAKRIVVALVPHGGQTWFFKLLGDDAVVAKEKAALLKFVQSVRFPNA